MSLDKFGRSAGESGEKKTLFVRGQRGNGFKLTENGDFDVENKRLTRVAASIDATDAVNADGLKNAFNVFRTEIFSKYDEYLTILRNEMNRKFSQDKLSEEAALTMRLEALHHEFTDMIDELKTSYSAMESRLMNRVEEETKKLKNQTRSITEDISNTNFKVDNMMKTLNKAMKDVSDTIDRVGNMKYTILNVDSAVKKHTDEIKNLESALDKRLGDLIKPFETEISVVEKSIKETVYGKQHVQLNSIRNDTFSEIVVGKYLLEGETIEYAFPYDEGFVEDFMISPPDVRVFMGNTEVKHDKIKTFKKGVTLSFKPSEENMARGDFPTMNCSFMINYPILIKTSHIGVG